MLLENKLLITLLVSVVGCLIKKVFKEIAAPKRPKKVKVKFKTRFMDLDFYSEER